MQAAIFLSPPFVAISPRVGISLKAASNNIDASCQILAISTKASSSPIVSKYLYS